MDMQNAMDSKKHTLKLPDYAIIGGALAVSVAIGLFYQFIYKLKTNDEYLLAGKNMSLMPVVVSLMATFMAAHTLMGIPADIYLFGTHVAFMNIGFVIGPVIAAYVFYPVYFENDVTTAYEYLEMRFGKTIRRLVSTSFLFQVVLFTSATLYAPALALSAVTNIPMSFSIISIGVVCTFYCSLGGMKAVLWADVFQAILMYTCLFVVIIKGSIDLGGIGTILNEAYDGGRIIIPRFSLNMETQYTMINVFLQGLIIALSSYGCSQTQVQRIRSLKNINRSTKAILWSIPLLVSFHLLCCLSGLILYVYFRNCDPLTSPTKPLDSIDQILPYFIITALQDYPGLSGLCISGIFSASLSTISSNLNSLTAVTVRDFLIQKWPSLSQSIVTAKIICLIYGILCIALTFLLTSLGNLIKIGLIIFGMFAGPNLGIFILGTCTKGTNEQGAIMGIIVSLSIAACLSFLPSKSQPPYLPVSNNCSLQHEVDVLSAYMTETPIITTEYSIISSHFKTIEEIPIKHGIPISFMWASSIALLTCLVVGYFGSIIASIFRKNVKEVPDIYLSPLRIWFSTKCFSKRKCSSVEMGDKIISKNTSAAEYFKSNEC